MLCRKAWMPPGRGGKSFVTIKVLRTPPTLPNPPRGPRAGRPRWHTHRCPVIMAAKARHADGQGARWRRRTRGGQAARLLTAWGATRLGAAAVRAEGAGVPGPDVTSDGPYDLRGLARRPAYRNRFRWTTSPGSTRPRRPSPSSPRAAALPGVRDGLLRPGLCGGPGRPRAAVARGARSRAPHARGVGVGGGRSAARSDGVRPLRRDWSPPSRWRRCSPPAGTRAWRGPWRRSGRC